MKDEEPEKLYAVCLKALGAVCLVPTNPAESIVFGIRLSIPASSASSISVTLFNFETLRVSGLGRR